MTDLNERLRWVRKEHGQRLVDIARITRTTTSFVSDVEHGRRKLGLINVGGWAEALLLERTEYVAAVLQQWLDEDGIEMVVEVRLP